VYLTYVFFKSLQYSLPSQWDGSIITYLCQFVAQNILPSSLRWPFWNQNPVCLRSQSSNQCEIPNKMENIDTVNSQQQKCLENTSACRHTKLHSRGQTLCFVTMLMQWSESPNQHHLRLETRYCISSSPSTD